MKLYVTFILFFFLLTLSVFAQNELLIISNNNLEKINLDSSGREVLENSISFPSYVTLSPDGEKIAFIYNGNYDEMGHLSGKVGIYSIEEKKLYPFDEVEVISRGNDFSWSPDGKTLATIDLYGSLFLIELPPSVRHIPRPDRDFIWSPSWMPSGEKIALRTSKIDKNIGNVTFFNFKTEDFTDVFISPYSLGGEYFVPPVTWSPSGNCMIFEVQSEDPLNYDIWFSDIYGRTQMAIAEGYWPYWDRETDSLLFLSAREDRDGDGKVTYYDMEIYMIESVEDYMDLLEACSSFPEESRSILEDSTVRISNDCNSNGHYFWLPDRRGIIYEVYREPSPEEQKEGISFLKSSIYIQDFSGEKPEFFLENASIVGFTGEKKISTPLPEINPETTPLPDNNPPEKNPSGSDLPGLLSEGTFKTLLILAGGCLSVVFILVIPAFFLIKKDKKRIPPGATLIKFKAEKKSLEKLKEQEDTLRGFLNDKKAALYEKIAFDGIILEVIRLEPESPAVINEKTDTEIIFE